MSLFNATISRSATNPAEQYDHAIDLIDHTKSQEPPAGPDADVKPLSSRDSSAPETSREGSSKDITKKLIRTGFREELTKRKYARWQEDRYSGSEDETGDDEAGGRPSMQSERAVRTETHESSATKSQVVEASDFAHRDSIEERGRLRTIGHKIKSQMSGRKASKHRKQADSEIDILYENQRGWFFCGIPLYSHRSLLNLDPAPWVTRDFKDSAVNITNAQPPDPSWEWAWKSWYVDMSYDVDEEGWQYSFGFSPKWSWHGSHPWFHDFVRRRRWLRKRIRRRSVPKGKDGTMAQAHMLNQDYFTIHGTRRSRDISADRTTNGRSSHISRSSMREEEDDVETSEVPNVPTLMKLLRKATVDRKKIDVVKRFIEQGGEELSYLEEQIPHILSQFVYQNDRRQLLSYLLKSVNDVRAHRGKHQDTGDPESESERRHIDNLLRAVRAADEQIRNLEYWSDVKHIGKDNRGGESVRLTRGSSTEEGIVSRVEDITPDLPEGKQMSGATSPAIGPDIKGIPEEAGLEQPGLKAIFESGGPDRTNKDSQNAEHNEKGKGVDRGKKKWKAVDDPPYEDDVPIVDISID